MHFLRFVVPTIVATHMQATAQIVTCDGTKYPDTDACQTIADQLKDDSTGQFCWDGSAGNCIIWTIDDKTNCMISNCLHTEGLCIPNGLAGYNYEQVRLSCFPVNSGGTFTTDSLDADTNVFNNPDYEPDSVAEVDGVVGGLKKTIMTQEQFDEWIESASATSRKAKRADDDTSFDLIQQFNTVEREGIRYQVGGRLPGGSSYTIQESDSHSVSYSFSSSVSAGIEGIVSAEIGVEFSEETSVTNTIGITINYPCDENKQGILYWYPTWDYYGGFLRPSGDELSVWVPLEEGQGNYRVECLG